jgi:hypothetical protein
VTKLRAADDFAMIRARMEELRRERAGALTETEHDPVPRPKPSYRAGRETVSEDGRLLPRFPVRRPLR